MRLLEPQAQVIPWHHCPSRFQAEILAHLTTASQGHVPNHYIYNSKIVTIPEYWICSKVKHIGFQTWWKLIFSELFSTKTNELSHKCPRSVWRPLWPSPTKSGRFWNNSDIQSHQINHISNPIQTLIQFLAMHVIICTCTIHSIFRRDSKPKSLHVCNDLLGHTQNRYLNIHKYKK